MIIPRAFLIFGEAKYGSKFFTLRNARRKTGVCFSWNSYGMPTCRPAVRFRKNQLKRIPFKLKPVAGNKKYLFAYALAAIILFVNSSANSQANVPAKKLFGARRLPAALKSRVYGGYALGCVAGAKALPVDGPYWQAMRLSRNRRWGHPRLLRIIEELSIKASRIGWNGLLVGDMSQPRGGPMLTGHRSHQNGLDVDIWFTPMPDRRLTYAERENISAISVLKRDSRYVDNSRWTQSHSDLLRIAAQFPEVERILVHPGVKKKLCDTVKGDRSWLGKIRPFWGHHYHFHLRIGCPEGSPGCTPQKAPPKLDGCGKPLAWWFETGLAPKWRKQKNPKNKKPEKPRKIVLSDLPQACKTVLNAPSHSLKASTYKIHAMDFPAPAINIPAPDITTILKSRPIELKKPAKRLAIPASNSANMPVPARKSLKTGKRDIRREKM